MELLHSSVLWGMIVCARELIEAVWGMVIVAIVRRVAIIHQRTNHAWKSKFKGGRKKGDEQRN